MKKTLMCILTLLLCVGIVSIDNNNVKAEETNDECTTESTGECTISDTAELKAWASNTNNNVVGKVISNITLDESITISNTKTLDLNGMTIKADNSLSGYMFYVRFWTYGKLTLEDSSKAKTGTIDGNYVKGLSEHEGEIGGFYNEKSLVINGGTIKNMYANDGSDCSGAAISNYDEEGNYQTSLVINDGLITDCFAGWYGGAIYNNSFLTINGGTIKNCSCNERGGAIYSYDEFGRSVAISGGLIKDCKSSMGAIALDNTPLILNGNAVLNNLDDYGNKNDICLETGSYIIVDDGFSQKSGDTIGLWISPSILNESSVEYQAVKKGTYKGTIDNLAKIFISSNGQEYTIKNTNSIDLKGVQLIQQPSFDTNYTIKTNKDETTNPIETSYQWYKSIIDDEVLIGDEGSYDVGDDTIEVSAYEGEFDQETNTWLLKGTDNYFILLELDNLKKGQVVSFDYVVDGISEDTQIFLADEDDNWYCIYVGNDSSGKYKAVVPKDGDYWVEMYADSEKGTRKLLDIAINNIYIKNRQEAEEIKGATSKTLTSGEAGADNFCRVIFKNTDSNAINYVDSYDVKFGKVIEGQDKQEIKTGSTNDVTIKLDKSEDKEYLAVKDMKVYVDGLSTELKTSQFNISEGTTKDGKYVTLTLKGSYVSTLPAGEHTFFVKMSNKEGYECTVTTLIVKGDAPTPTPTPSPKDESCEKVIGPTWHWNNKKGICEDTGVVKTYTR